MSLRTPEHVEAFLERHWGLALWVARRRAERAGWRGDPDEVQSDALLGLWRAARTWDPSHGRSEPSWARFCIERDITDGLRTRHGRRGHDGNGHLNGHTVPLDEDVARCPDHRDHVGQAVDRVAVARALAGLTPRHRLVAVARWRDDLTWRAIGAHLGVTESRACQLGTEARSILERALAPHEEGPHLRCPRGGGRSCVAGPTRTSRPHRRRGSRRDRGTAAPRRPARPPA